MGDVLVVTITRDEHVNKGPSRPAFHQDARAELIAALNVVDYVEPKPGIPPTPSHTLELINTMKRDNIKLILVEPYFDLRTPNSIANAVGGQVVVLLPSVGGVKEVNDYFQLFDYDIKLLTEALAKIK